MIDRHLTLTSSFHTHAQTHAHIQEHTYRKCTYTHTLTMQLLTEHISSVSSQETEPDWIPHLEQTAFMEPRPEKNMLLPPGRCNQRNPGCEKITRQSSLFNIKLQGQRWTEGFRIKRFERQLIALCSFHLGNYTSKL